MNTPQHVIAEAIDYLVAHYQEQPELDFLAKRAGYETTYFQKLFREHVGISPKRLAQYMNMRRARDLLGEGHSTLSAAQETGLSGTGRLYDLFVSCEAVTPGDVSHKGRGLAISYGFHPTPLGEIMVATTERGVCFLGFLMDESRNGPVARLRKHFPFAQLDENSEVTAKAAEQIMQIWACKGRKDQKLALDLHGTNMQIQVWQALLRIPYGQTVTYKDIATEIGKPAASRAVGNAVGTNPISLLIPCHRVIQASGIVDNYGWGSARKKLLLATEGAAAL